MQDRLFSILVLVSVLVVWVVVFASAIKIARKRGNILKRMGAINAELSALNEESWNGNTTPERDAEIDKRFEVLNAEFDKLIDEFDGRK